MPPHGRRPTGWRVLAALLVLAVSAFVQFGTVLLTRHDGVIHGDAAKYVFYAWNLKHHHTFSMARSFGDAPAEVAPDKLTLPGYPAFLSLFVAGTPDRGLVRRATLAQAGLGVVSALLAFLIGLRLLPLGWATVAGVLVAIQPHLAVVSTHLMTEPLFTCLMLAAVLSILAAARAEAGFRHDAVAGLLVGLASMVRPQLQLLPLLAIAGVILAPRLRPLLPRVLLAAAVFAAVVGPWQVRNHGIERGADEPDLLVSTLYHGSFPGFMYRDDARTRGYPYRFDPDQSAATRDLRSALSHIGGAIADEPARYARWYLLGKPAAFLSWGIIAGVGDIFVYEVASSPFVDNALFAALRTVSFVLHWPLMLLAVAGVLLVFWRRHLPGTGEDADRRRAQVVLAALLAYLVVIHAIGAPYPRYNIPFRPLFFVMGLAMLQAVAMRWRFAGKQWNTSTEGA